MTRLLYKEAECRYCFNAVFLPHPSYRQSDLKKYTAVICRDCREELSKLFDGVVLCSAP